MTSVATGYRHCAISMPIAFLYLSQLMTTEASWKWTMSLPDRSCPHAPVLPYVSACLIIWRLPWLNVSEVARAVGINKSLLARYIYGISKPSEQRVNQIRATLRGFARELQMV